MNGPLLAGVNTVYVCLDCHLIQEAPINVEIIVSRGRLGCEREYTANCISPLPVKLNGNEANETSKEFPSGERK